VEETACRSMYFFPPITYSLMHRQIEMMTFKDFASEFPEVDKKRKKRAA
jgi:hypothetical protein